MEAAVAVPPQGGKKVEEPKDFKRFVQGPEDKAPKRVPFVGGTEWVQPTDVQKSYDGGEETETARTVFKDVRTDEQILAGWVPPLPEKPKEENPRPKAAENSAQRVEDEMLVRFHMARCKALVGNPEAYSLDEVQEISDLLPMKTLPFDQWFKLQLFRQKQALEAQAPPK